MILGVAPKTATRLLRFAAVRRAIDRRPARWGELAAGGGYAGESHLHREFRQFAGITPGQFAAR